MHAHRFATLLAAVFLLAGCAMRGGSATAVPVLPALKGQAPAAAGGQRVGLKFLIPDAKRSPQPEKGWGYISPGSKSVKVISAGTTNADVTAQSPLCRRAQGGRLCVVRDVLVYPKQSVVVKFYDGPLNASGHATGSVLSYGKAVPRLAKFVRIYQYGLIDRIGAKLRDANPPGGVASSTPISLTLYDAAGFVIPQPTLFYANTREAFSIEPKPLTIAFEVTTSLAFNNDTFSFVSDGHFEKGANLFLKQSADVELRYAGRGVRDAQLKVTGPRNTVKIDIRPKAGFGSSIALPSIGPDAKICSLRLGAVWYTEPATKKIAEYNPQHPGLKREFTIDSGRTPLDIACVNAEISGSEVYVALSGDVLGELAQNHDLVNEMALPTANAGLHSVGIQSYPADNATFTEELVGKVGVFSRDPLLGPWYEFPVPAGGHPTEIFGEWFSDPANNAVGTVDSTPAAVEYPLPHPASQPGALTEAAQTNAIWFVELAAARIGTIDPRNHAIKEYKTAAPLQHIAPGWDGRIYATDNKNQIEEISPNGRVAIIGRRSEQLIGIVAGGDADLWVLTWSAKGSSLLEVVP